MERVVLTHFSHEHPLVLIPPLVPNENNKQSICYGCQEPITTASYSCQTCNYSLHKKCGELPLCVKHPEHPEHPLTLLAHPNYRPSYCICNVCGVLDSWRWFVYHCSKCKFDAHVSCTPLEERPNEHKFHSHPLTFTQRPASFVCDACGTEGEDLSYRCTNTSCQFWIHDKCASSENTIQRNDHPHPLQLSYSIPHSKRKFDHDCYICGKVVHPNYWVYYCPLCTYFVAHLKCGTSEEEPLILSDNISIENLVRVPVPGLMNMMNQFFIDIAYGDTRIACPNSHYWSWIDDDIDLSNKMKKKETLCDICMQPISLSSQFSNCAKCSFVAHAKCTFFKLEINHPSHQQHPLTLLTLAWTGSKFKLPGCKICGGCSNGFFFDCETCDNFLIDVDCATTSLPSIIKHDAHNHPLTLLESTNEEYQYCKACGELIDYGMNYRCESSISCDFRLHTNCAMLPGTLEHDWDRHKMSLTYPPFNHPENYFCETCEEDIHPTHWLYHCSKCDHSFHTNCAHPHDEFSKVKFGITYKFKDHEHNLTSVRKPKKSHPCDNCGLSVSNFPHLDCASCNYHVCVYCVNPKDTQRIEFLSDD